MTVVPEPIILTVVVVNRPIIKFASNTSDEGTLRRNLGRVGK